MIDIHSHILPGIDDGPQTMEDSIRMARIASDHGVHTLITTPHSNLEGVYDNYYDEELKELFLAFQANLKKDNIPLRIVPGMEVYATEDVPELLNCGKLITLNLSKYLLIEFSFIKDLSLTDFLISELSFLGIRLIIAHPERYPYVQRHPNIVYDWIAGGCFLQINKGSILGSFGPQSMKTARFLLKHNLVSLIASDSHGPQSRTPELTGAFEFIKCNYSQEYAEVLFKSNPSAVIEDKELIDLKKMEDYRRVVNI